MSRENLMAFAEKLLAEGEAIAKKNDGEYNENKEIKQKRKFQRWKSITDDQKEEVIRLRKDGKSYTEVRELCGVSVSNAMEIWDSRPESFKEKNNRIHGCIYAKNIKRRGIIKKFIKEKDRIRKRTGKHEEIFRLRCEGKTYKEIGLAIGYSGSHIRYICLEYPCYKYFDKIIQTEIKYQKTIYDKYHKQGIIKLRTEGKTYKEIGELLNISHVTAGTICNHFLGKTGYKKGYKFHEKYKISIDRNKTIIDMRKKGKKLREIAKEFGVSHQRIQQILKKLSCVDGIDNSCEIQHDDIRRLQHSARSAT